MQNESPPSDFKILAREMNKCSSSMAKWSWTFPVCNCTSKGKNTTKIRHQHTPTNTRTKITSIASLELKNRNQNDSRTNSSVRHHFYPSPLSADSYHLRELAWNTWSALTAQRYRVQVPANVAPKASMAAKNEKTIQTDKSTCSRGHTSLEQFLCIRAAFWELHPLHHHNFFVNMHNFLPVFWQPQVCWNMPEYIQVAWMLPEEHFTSFPSKCSHIKQVHMSS